MARSMLAYSRAVQTRRSLELVMRSLAVYVKLYDRLPWAASNNGGLEKENVAIGQVPFKTLCLEQDVAKDGNKNKLIYVVNPKLAHRREKSPLRKGSRFMQLASNHDLQVVLEDGTEAINFDDASVDFCALVLISLPPKSQHLLDEIVQASEERIIIRIPNKNSGVNVKWISRGNLSVLCD
jgi:hypothetical protein